MALSPGTRLGPYEIVGAIGAGGMGEVFRARDLKLNRDVAIKVLPAAFADDPERLARFTREAQTLASLNHPNIATIYGIEEIASSDASDGLVAMKEGAASDDRLAVTKGAGASRALIMELVPGEDLSAHIARGPIPVAEALPIARQIAEALEAAHEQGIVHRDLKPANIKVRDDGTVKVLDFGLAKARDPAGASLSNPNLSHSPTLTHQGTSAGMIIGTAAYMSPEQAKGKSVDKRTDIWAFGVVLYEMLTGKRAFKGDDVSETLASVLKDTLSMDALPAPTPPRIRRLIERCLERDLKTRLRDIGEARIEIARTEAGGPDLAPPTPAPSTAASSTRLRVLTALSAALAVGLIGSVVAWAPLMHPREALTPLRLTMDLGAEIGGRSPFALSPDGGVLAFAGSSRADEPTTLHIQRLDRLKPAILPGTEGAASPFFSPDGKSIAFFADGKLKRIELAGGPTSTLCDVADPRGATWSENGTIIFAPSATGGLVSVPSTGGTPTPLTTLGGRPDEVAHRYPQALPGGQAVLFTLGSPGRFEAASIAVQSAPNGPVKILIEGGYHGRYLRSGHIVYVRLGSLMAAPFNLRRLEVTGPAVPVLEAVNGRISSGGADFSFSDGGSLVYVPDTNRDRTSPISWIGRDGKTQPLLDPGNYESLTFSPNGARLALVRREGENKADIWVYDWKEKGMSRLTFDPELDGGPVWSPRGGVIAFRSQRDGSAPNLYWQRADGAGEAVRLAESPYPQVPLSWHPSGRFLAFMGVRPGTSIDLMILPMEGDDATGWRAGTPYPFVSTPFRETGGAFSPDGRWLAYNSNESGRFEVYVRPFPGPGGRWQVSTDGGWKPVWSKQRNEILFTTPSGAILVAPYSATADSFRPERPQSWSQKEVNETEETSRVLDLHPDGERVAAIMADPGQPDQGTTRSIVFIQNFFDDLRRLAPAGTR